MHTINYIIRQLRRQDTSPEISGIQLGKPTKQFPHTIYLKTAISIQGTDLYINEVVTYKDQYHDGRRVEGLLFKSRMVQAIFDDENPKTMVNWFFLIPTSGIRIETPMNSATHYPFTASMDYWHPNLINEDSIDVPNLDIAVDKGASWGFYQQGFGSNYRDYRWD